MSDKPQRLVKTIELITEGGLLCALITFVDGAVYKYVGVFMEKANVTQTEFGEEHFIHVKEIQVHMDDSILSSIKWTQQKEPDNAQ